MTVKLANNASGLLSVAINASDTGIVLRAGDGAEFPALGAGEYFYATITSPQGTQEIVKATARVGDTLTVVRAQEGTTANSFAADSRFELRVTAQSVEDLVVDYDTALRGDLAAPTGTSLVGHIQAGSGAVTTTVQAKLRETVSVKDFGAVGDGVTDDTTAIQNAFNTGAGHITFPHGTYKFDSILVSSPCVIEMGQALCISDKATAGHFFLVKSDDVTIQNGRFGRGTEKVGIVIVGDNHVTQFKNFCLRNTWSSLDTGFDVGAVQLQIAVLSVIENNTFLHSTLATGAIAINVQNIDDDLVLQDYTQVINNHFDGYGRAFDNFMIGDTYGQRIIGNTIINCTVGLRMYHAFACLVDGNIIRNNSSPVFFWQRGTYINNEISGSTGAHAVNIETLNGVFSGNTIRDTQNAGVLLDGTNDGLFSNNAFYDIGGHAIEMIGLYPFGFQPNSVRIIDNFILACKGSGIYANINTTYNSVYICGNQITGAGWTNSTQQPSVVFVGDRALNRLVFKENVISESDVAGLNVQGNSKYGLYIDGAGDKLYWVENNWFDTEYSVFDTAISRGRQQVYRFNRVQDKTKFQLPIAGVGGAYRIIQGNYDYEDNWADFYKANSMQTQSQWDLGGLRMGSYYLWVDATGDLRIKNGAPTSDTDGTIVGTQS